MRSQSLELTREENRAFYRMTIALVIPMALQNLINVGVTTADVVMLGKVGETALSGASLAGQVQFIMNLIFFGLTSGASVLTAQYWGKRDVRTIERVFGISLSFSLGIGLLFFAAAQILPRQLMYVFTPEEPVILEGISYLRIVSWSYLPVAFTMIYLNLMRSVERVVVATWTYFISLIVNIIGNAILIFGLFHVPAMGVRGAAYATVFARIVELAIVVIYMNWKGNPLRLHLRDFVKFEKLLLKDFLVFSGPVIANELMWGLGMSANAAIIGHLGSAAVAANSVAQVSRQLIMVIGFGLAAATSIMIGKAIGEQKLRLAEIYARKFVRLSVGITLIAAVGLFLCRGFIAGSMTISAQSKDYLSFMLFVVCYYAVFQSYNTTLIVGVFRAGGDTKIGFFIDLFGMWCCSILLGFVAAFWLHWGVKAVFIVLLSDEIVKVPISTWRYRKKLWLRNITREMDTN
ncbi:MAG: MATE family efflux transporter [Lachnospiraceae bacterium]|nr:MATE family efflux transporter [Lachnospiraceae bacterium]